MEEYYKQLSEIYNELKPFILTFNNFPLVKIKTDVFEPTLKAALIKNFEFNYDLNNTDTKYAFYLTSFLRGMCEDLISLKFISQYSEADRNELLILYNNYLVFTSLKSQADFFKVIRPLQPVLQTADVENGFDDVKSKLNLFWEKHGQRKDKIFPGVEHMAIDTKLKLLYDYLYHATSKAVHFTPAVLLRNGWYNKDGPIIFRNDNFSSYYKLFNTFYGTYLFIAFVQEFKKIIPFNKEVKKLVNRLKETQNKLNFFPEILTFEEMNVKRPHAAIHRTMELIEELNQEERKQVMEMLPEILRAAQKEIADKKAIANKKL